MSLWISNFLNISAFVNMKVIFVVINTTWAVVKIRPEKNSGLYEIWTHDLCNTAAVFHSASLWWWVKILYRPEKFFFRPYFHYCSFSVYYCEDYFHTHVFIHSSNRWLSYIHSSNISFCLEFLCFSWNHFYVISFFEW